MIKNRYFVSYVYVNRGGTRNDGNCYVDIPNKITTMAQVMAMQEHLREENNWASIVIMNYIFLEQVPS